MLVQAQREIKGLDESRRRIVRQKLDYVSLGQRVTRYLAPLTVPESPGEAVLVVCKLHVLLKSGIVLLALALWIVLFDQLMDLAVDV